MQVGLEAGVGERRHQRIEHVGERALELRGLRQRTRIGLFAVRPVAVEGELVEQVGRRRGSGSQVGVVGEAVGGHGRPLRCGRAHARPSGDPFAGSGRGPHPKAFRLQGRSAAEDGEHGFLVSRGMAAPFAPPGEESRAQPLRVSAGSGPIAPLKAGRGCRRGRTGRKAAGHAQNGLSWIGSGRGQGVAGPQAQADHAQDVRVRRGPAPRGPC